MLKRCLLILLCLTGLAVAEPRAHGVWYLDSVTIEGRTARDPRWTILWDLSSDGTFGMSSTTVVEKRKTDGTTVPISENVTLRGTWRIQDGRLYLEVKDPTPEQAEFLRVNFPGHPRVELDGTIRVISPNRTLHFHRHKKNA